MEIGYGRRKPQGAAKEKQAPAAQPVAQQREAGNV